MKTIKTLRNKARERVLIALANKPWRVFLQTLGFGLVAGAAFGHYFL